MHIQVILHLNQEEKLLGNKFSDNLKKLNSVTSVADYSQMTSWPLPVILSI